MKTAVPLQQQTTESGGLWSAHARPWAERFLIYGVLLVFAIITGAPFFYMISGSFKFNAEIFSYPLTFIPRAPTLDNYGRLLSGSEIPYVRQFGNSVIVAVSQTLLTLLISSMVGWGFAKFEFSGKRALFLFLLATLMFPYQVTLVPLFLLMLRLGWLDTYLAIVIPGAISAFGVFFMRQNMLAIPDELIDAAVWTAHRIGASIGGLGCRWRAARSPCWRCSSFWVHGMTICGRSSCCVAPTSSPTPLGWLRWWASIGSSMA